MLQNYLFPQNLPKQEKGNNHPFRGTKKLREIGNNIRAIYKISLLPTTPRLCNP